MSNVHLGQAAVRELLPLLAGPVNLVHALVQADLHLVQVGRVQLPG